MVGCDLAHSKTFDRLAISLVVLINENLLDKLSCKHAVHHPATKLILTNTLVLAVSFSIGVGLQVVVSTF